MEVLMRGLAGCFRASKDNLNFVGAKSRKVLRNIGKVR